MGCTEIVICNQDSSLQKMFQKLLMHSITIPESENITVKIYPSFKQRDKLEKLPPPQKKNVLFSPEFMINKKEDFFF